MMIAAGPRDAEAELIGWVREHRARDAADVWPPLRIVVPSRSLRRHLLAVLAAKLGALAGVRVQTHRSLAHEVLDRAGEAPPAGGSTAQELLVRRIAAGEPALRDALGGLEDGYAPVAAAVRDLIDAGFEDAMMDRAVDAVLRSGLTGDRLQRALAVLRVAAAVIDAGRKLACPHRGTLLERAATRLAAEPEVLPARGVLVVGFAEATGLVTRLLRALVERPDAEIIVEHPPDPARPETPDAGWIFTERLRTALDLPRPPDRLPMPEPPRLDLFRAPGPEAEVRETAARIRRLLDGGAAPESIAVIARRLDESLLAVVRRQLDRLGIPFSAESATMPGGAEARRARALARLLSDGPDTPVPVWLTALEPGPAIGDPAVLELALRAAGADTVGRVAGLDATLLCGDRGHFATPVVERIEERDGVEHRIRIQVPRAVLERAIGLAERLRHRIEARPERLGPAELLEWTSGVLAALGWPGDERDPVRAALAGLAAEIPPGLPVAWEELAPLCTRTLAGLGAVPAGGDGGGVQVLSVTEARGRTFEHVFLIALNRGLFPFRRPEDPMLPEAARRALADLLPEIPLAARSPLEERYLFAQLLAAAPAVTLGFATMDAEARELNPSAFLERLDLEGRLPRPLHGGAAEFPPADDVLTPGREDEVPAPPRAPGRGGTRRPQVGAGRDARGGRGSGRPPCRRHARGARSLLLCGAAPRPPWTASSACRRRRRPGSRDWRPSAPAPGGSWRRGSWASFRRPRPASPRAASAGSCSAPSSTPCSRRPSRRPARPPGSRWKSCRRRRSGPPGPTRTGSRPRPAPPPGGSAPRPASPTSPPPWRGGRSVFWSTRVRPTGRTGRPRSWRRRPWGQPPSAWPTASW
jgi:Superfamily I DNA and RNA helicases